MLLCLRVRCGLKYDPELLIGGYWDHVDAVFLPDLARRHFKKNDQMTQLVVARAFVTTVDKRAETSGKRSFAWRYTSSGGGTAESLIRNSKMASFALTTLYAHLNIGGNFQVYIPRLARDDPT